MTTQRTAADLPLNRPASRASRPSEAGSAYLATLLVLVVLTILGLSLAVITQTEVLIGGSEKQSTRQLFNANSGVSMATGTEMVTEVWRDQGYDVDCSLDCSVCESKPVCDDVREVLAARKADTRVRSPMLRTVDG